MTEQRDDRIRQRAYGIWESEGHPSGRDREHWYRAERDVAEEEGRSQPDRERPEATVESPEPVRPPDAEASQADEAVEAMEQVSRRKRDR